MLKCYRAEKHLQIIHKTKTELQKANYELSHINSQGQIISKNRAYESIIIMKSEKHNFI